MQVSHVNTHVTHAVLGGGETMGFGISDSAEFFQILSKNIYSDQQLAVVREIMCNGWDAHIAAGKTSTPIRVTLTPTEFKVEDMGEGIHPDMVQPLFLTYGGSDKKLDGRQTGGLGLGCKVPFAYGDHFTMASAHQGTKTIYAIAKASADRKGKPGAVPVASFPTTESGVTVTVPLKAGDCDRFEKLIKRVAFNGEMLVELNGEQLPVLPMSEAPFGWLFTTTTLTNRRDDGILVRLGNVLYPVESHAGYHDAHYTIATFIRTISNSYYDQSANLSLVLQAKPNSLAVMPSREALSMQEHTVAALKLLLKKFAMVLGTPLENACKTVLDRQLARAIDERNAKVLLSGTRTFPYIADEKLGTETTLITTIEGLADQYSRHRYPTNDAFFYKDMARRLDAAATLEMAPRGHLQQLKHHIQRQARIEVAAKAKRQVPKDSIEQERAKGWFLRKIIRPLARDLHNDPMMDAKRLGLTTEYSAGRAEPGRGKLNLPCYFTDYITTMRRIVVITHTTASVTSDARNFPEMEALGTTDNLFYYVAPKAPTKLAHIRQFFADRGFIILDRTVPQPWDPVKLPRLPRAPSTGPKRVKKEGYPQLSGCRVPSESLRVDHCFRPDAPRLTTPPAFFEAVTRSRSDVRNFRLGSFDSEVSRDVFEVFGAEGVVVSLDTQQAKLLKEGVPTLDEYVVAQVTQEITTSPRFLAYWEESLERQQSNKDGKASDSGYERERQRLLLCSPLRLALGLTSELDPRERRILRIWQGILEQRTWFPDALDANTKMSTTPARFIAATCHTITKLPLSPKMGVISGYFHATTLLDALKLDVTIRVLNDTASDLVVQDHQRRATLMVVAALKG